MTSEKKVKQVYPDAFTAPDYKTMRGWFVYAGGKEPKTLAHLNHKGTRYSSVWAAAWRHIQAERSESK